MLISRYQVQLEQSSPDFHLRMIGAMKACIFTDPSLLKHCCGIYAAQAYAPVIRWSNHPHVRSTHVMLVSC